MGNKNGKSKDATKHENESEEAKQKEREGLTTAKDQLAGKEKGTNVDEINKADDIVNDLKANTDLDDEQCDQNVPTEKIDFKSEDKKEMENKEFANDIKAEKEHNADSSEIVIVSKSEGLKTEETEAPIGSIHVAENNQPPLKMEALNEQASVTENEINAVDKIDTESNLSNPSGDTETSVHEINTTKETNDIKSDSVENIVQEQIENMPKESEEAMSKPESFENIEEDSIANLPKEDEKATPIVAEQEPLCEEIALTDNGDNVREMDVKINEEKFVEETIVHDTNHAEKSCVEIKNENITESQQENEDKTVIKNEDKTAIVTETENADEIACMKDNHSNENNEGDNTTKIDSADKHEANEEEERITSTESDQEEVKIQVKQENSQDEQKENSCVQHIIEPISSETVDKISEKCLETGIESGKDNANENLKMVTVDFCWKHGGTDVQILGSFNNLESKMVKSQSGNEFVLPINMVPGEYTYRFCVDGEWKVDTNEPITTDNEGNKMNVVNFSH